MGTIGTSIDTTVTKLEDRLELWGVKLNELVAKAEVAGQEAKIDARKHLDDLKAKLADARAKLDDAKAAGGETWEKFKVGVEHSWKELEGAFHKLTH